MSSPARSADADPANRRFLESLGQSERRASWARPLPAAQLAQDLAAQDLPALDLNGAADKTGARKNAALDSVRAIMMIRAYRVRGHLDADLDPLRLTPRARHPELDPLTYGFAANARQKPIFLDQVLGREQASIDEICAILRETYCGPLGVEFMHIFEPEEKDWIQRRVENEDPRSYLDDQQKLALLEKLIEVEEFEKFLAVKYTGTKRFGLDGAESLIPALDHILAASSALGAQEAVMGMAHRGRLNVLAHILGKPPQAIFHEFGGGSNLPDDVEGSGDVKYHLGSSADRVFGNKTLHISLSANPSHLEAVNPVVLGKSRAKQDQLGRASRSGVLPLLIHGDAAFAGQGVVAECFGLSGLKGHRSGGAVHFIVNNQIGFTTSPHYGRSSPYPSDVGKIVQAPIFHVNGDRPEYVLYAARLAAEFRHKFRKPAVVDMFCYRRFGHNEADEPMFTQPLMYKKIKTHPSVAQLYGERLQQDGLASAEKLAALRAAARQKLQADFDRRAEYRPAGKNLWLAGRWEGFAPARGSVRRGATGTSRSALRQLAEKLYHIPEGFNAHAGVRRLAARKLAMITGEEKVDWAAGEALAFASLLQEGYGVRLVGQDSERGTFSQRHAVLVDQNTEDAYIPLAAIKPAANGKPPAGSGRFEAVNSMLSEEAVLGFEFGYSLQAPNTLVLWEAQFGDFANGAQVITDQFISSGESKWLRMSGLVMLLPHGYEGQGPEHSSARPERFLQMCAQDNMQVANCTTPANYFHILRRQLHRRFRKPLILMTPKSLLRHPDCVSPLENLGARSSFHRILADDEMTKPGSTGVKLAAAKDMKRVILCSGKVYYDLVKMRRALRKTATAIIRIEQLYPFPFASLARELARFAKPLIVWCQEEPKNMGGWDFVRPRLEEVFALAGRPDTRVIYAGRRPAASPATGFFAAHERESAKFLTDAFMLRRPLPAAARRFGKKRQTAAKPLPDSGAV